MNHVSPHVCSCHRDDRRRQLEAVLFVDALTGGGDQLQREMAIASSCEITRSFVLLLKLQMSSAQGRVEEGVAGQRG